MVNIVKNPTFMKLDEVLRPQGAYSSPPASSSSGCSSSSVPSSGSPESASPGDSSPISSLPNFPALSGTGDKLPRIQRYRREIESGERRSTGAKKLKKLTNRHYNIISRHIAGQSQLEIQADLKLSINTISRVLNDPLAKTVIDQAYRDRQAEVDALTGLALDATRNSLRHGSVNEKLRAVGAFAKLKDTIAKETNPEESAEDFAQSIVRKAENVQVNIYKD